MIFKRSRGISRMALGAAAIPMLAVGLLGAGCHSNTATASSAAGAPGVGSSASGGTTVAKQETPIGANNPPPGQPNHMSPEMQAQLEHYRQMGQHK